MEYRQTNLFDKQKKVRKQKPHNTIETLYFSSVEKALNYLEQIKINAIIKGQSNAVNEIDIKRTIE
jgi:hypothetical protein